MPVSGALTAMEEAWEVASSEDDEISLTGHHSLGAVGVATHALSPAPGLVTQEIQSDSDSAIEANELEFTTTMEESLRDSIEEYGRMYHKYNAGKYPLPDDKYEQERLDMFHEVWKLTLKGRYYLAPVKPCPQNILDMGTGTGIWAIDVADEMPSAAVRGVDLSAIQPTWIPPNLIFIMDDLESPWVDTRHFDFIFARDLTHWIKHPNFVLESAFEALAPGGYMEFQSINFSSARDSHVIGTTAFEEWVDLINQGANNLSLNWHTASDWRTQMEQVGLVDIQSKEYEWPIHMWDQENIQLGALVYSGLVESKGIHAISAKLLTEGMEMDICDVNLLIERVAKELRRKSTKATIPTFVVYGRKPA